MQNTILTFTNIKGGTGKSTLSAIFASYLVSKGIPVFVIDADLQASLYRHRQREVDVDPDAKIPWTIEMLNTAEYKNVEETIAKLKQVPGVVIIDCPGNLNDKNLLLVYQAADVAIIPMSFDADTVDATGIFVKAMKRVSSAKLIFAPNRINTSEGKSEELRQRAQTTELLGLVGTVLPRIKQSVVVKRYNTLYPLDKPKVDAVEKAFDRIITELNLNA